MRVGITGHQRLASGTTWQWVEGAILQQLRPIEDLEAITSLAVGADQLFARCALAVGGKLLAVLPFANVSRTFGNETDLSEFQKLRASATVIVMPDQCDDETAYLEAGRKVVELSDLLIAVWDGLPAKGKGGTGDAVNHAIAMRKPVLHLNPYNQTVTKIEPEK